MSNKSLQGRELSSPGVGSQHAETEARAGTLSPQAGLDRASIPSSQGREDQVKRTNSKQSDQLAGGRDSMVRRARDDRALQAKSVLQRATGAGAHAPNKKKTAGGLEVVGSQAVRRKTARGANTSTQQSNASKLETVK